MISTNYQPRNAVLGARFAIGALAFYCASVVAYALDFEFTYMDGFENRVDAIAAMERAASAWEYVLSDPITVRIDVRQIPLLDIGLATGASFAESVITEYSAVRDALVVDAQSATDMLAVSNLPAGPQLTFRTWTPEGETIVNSGDDAINGYVGMFRSQAKAIGLPVTGDPTDRDGEIQWNEFFLDNNFDFDRSDGVSGTDFETIAMHELGHVLGFASGVDVVDESSLPAGPLAPEELSSFAIVQVLDLFRYSAESVPLLDFAPDTAAYFSRDGGATSLAAFSTGQFNGDGWQAGHWEGESGQGVMDANPLDVIVTPSLSDLMAMDVIGWDLAISADFTKDGEIDAGDLARWKSEFGLSDNSDADHDGDTDGADFLAWQRQFGVITSSTIAVDASNVVPEPGAAAILTLAANLYLASRPPSSSVSKLIRP